MRSQELAFLTTILNGSYRQSKNRVLKNHVDSVPVQVSKRALIMVMIFIGRGHDSFQMLCHIEFSFYDLMG